MEKVTQFLEAYVQWLVLGLCVLFLGFLSYSYWVAPRSVAKIDGRPVQPDEINDAILKGPVKRIDDEVQKEAPSISVKDHSKTFVDTMSFTDPSLAAIFKPLPAAVIGGNSSDQKDAPDVNTTAVAYKATATVTLPAPQDIDFSNGRTTVRIDDPEAKILAANPAAVLPAADKPPKRKPNDPAGAALAAAKTKDIDWDTVAANIPATDLEAAFNNVFKASGDDEVPPELFATRILKVEMHRQEKLTDGTWSSEETAVPALEMYKMRALPSADAEQKTSYEFIDWAISHAEFIATPPFYQTEKGKPWTEPGTNVPGTPGMAAAAAMTPAPNAPFDPAHPPKKMTAEQRKMVADYKKAQRSMKNGGPGVPGMMPPGMMPGGMPRPPGTKSKPYYQQTPPTRTRTAAPQRQPGFPMPPMPPGYGGMMPPGYGRTPYPGMMPPGYGRSPMPGMPGMPGGAFNPRAGAGSGTADINVQGLANDLKIWAHDETVQPGKTYRYRIRYAIQNPLFGAGPNIDCDPKLKQLLWIESPFSEWSEPVHISDRVNFWLAKMTGTASSFEVFEWKNDGWTSHMRSVGPGDQIPGTVWTLADMRKDVKGPYVLLMNEAGLVERRDLKTDSESTDYQEMKDEAAAPKAPAQ